MVLGAQPSDGGSFRAPLLSIILDLGECLLQIYQGRLVQWSGTPFRLIIPNTTWYVRKRLFALRLWNGGSYESFPTGEVSHGLGWLVFAENTRAA